MRTVKKKRIWLIPKGVDWSIQPIVMENVDWRSASWDKTSFVKNDIYPLITAMKNYPQCGPLRQKNSLFFFNFAVMYTIYSGGAKGVDTEVEHLAARYGHNCVVKIPPCHERSEDGKLTSLDKATMDSATNFVLRAANYLGKAVTSPITLQYLQRNYQIVKPASQVLALSYFDQYRKHVQDGVWPWHNS